MLVSCEAALHVLVVCASGACLDYTLILASQGRGGDSSRNKLNGRNKSAASDSHRKTIPPLRAACLLSPSVTAVLNQVSQQQILEFCSLLIHQLMLQSGPFIPKVIPSCRPAAISESITEDKNLFML